MSDKVVQTIAMLELDRFSATVIGQLHESGVGAILLKGPTFADWLYTKRSDRPYGDVDVYVDPDQWAKAVGVLAALGLSDDRAGEAESERSRHATAFIGAEGWAVDLHRTIAGCEAPVDLQWSCFSDHLERMDLLGTEVTMFDTTGRALHVALHAAQHGRTEQKPLDDLERALAIVTPDEWGSVAELAKAVGATDALSAGLRLAPEGERVAELLSLPTAVPAHIRLRVDGGGGARAMNVANIATAPSLKLKFQYLWRWVFPSRTKMKRLSPESSAGRRHLALQYLRHLRRWPRAITALREWREARLNSPQQR